MRAWPWPWPWPWLRRVTSAGFPAILVAELRIALGGAKMWWYLGAIGVVIASLFVPLETARRYLLPIAWIWPLLVWSGMGCREAKHGTGALVFSTAHPLRKQLPAQWLSGFLLAVVVGGGVAARLAIAGEVTALLAWTAGALFIPSFALAAGVWSGGSKLFEALYTILWYVGPMSANRELDFMGATDRASSSGSPLVILALAGALSAIAVAGRKRQLAGLHEARS